MKKLINGVEMELVRPIYAFPKLGKFDSVEGEAVRTTIAPNARILAVLQYPHTRSGKVNYARALVKLFDHGHRKILWAWIDADQAERIEHAKKNPLKRGYSRRTISGNIAREMHHGKPQSRAVAMSLRSARSSYIKLHPRWNPSASGDAVAAHELALFIISDGELYRQQGLPIIQNLRRKIKRGIYKANLVLKLWRYLADSGAKKYTFEHDVYSPTGSYAHRAATWRNVKGYGIFTVPIRIATARELAAHYEEQVRAKENSHRTPIISDAQLIKGTVKEQIAELLRAEGYDFISAMTEAAKLIKEFETSGRKRQRILTKSHSFTLVRKK